MVRGYSVEIAYARMKTVIDTRDIFGCLFEQNVSQMRSIIFSESYCGVRGSVNNVLRC